MMSINSSDENSMLLNKVDFPDEIQEKFNINSNQSHSRTIIIGFFYAKYTTHEL